MKPISFPFINAFSKDILFSFKYIFMPFLTMKNHKSYHIIIKIIYQILWSSHRQILFFSRDIYWIYKSTKTCPWTNCIKYTVPEGHNFLIFHMLTERRKNYYAAFVHKMEYLKKAARMILSFFINLTNIFLFNTLWIYPLLLLPFLIIDFFYFHLIIYSSL